MIATVIENYFEILNTISRKNLLYCVKHEIVLANVYGRVCF